MIREAQGKKIGVLYGGWSSERDVSLRSGRNVYEALLKLGYKDTILIDVKRSVAEDLKREGIDIAVIMLHGKGGEDGSIQGLLEVLGIPYTGSRVLASSIGMDKFITKHILKSLKIPTPRAVFATNNDNIYEKVKEVEEKLIYPVIVKPRSEGSSVGIHIVRDRDELLSKLEENINLYGHTLIEQFIEGQAVTVGILGTGKKAFCVPSLELRVKGRAFYDYVAKYTKGYTEFIIPAEIPEHSDKKLKEYALKFYNAIEGRGFSRVDAVVDEKGEVYILEINTIPGMTDLSDLPKEAEKMGISYEEVAEYILRSAFE